MERVTCTPKAGSFCMCCLHHFSRDFTSRAYGESTLVNRTRLLYTPGSLTAKAPKSETRQWQRLILSKSLLCLSVTSRPTSCLTADLCWALKKKKAGDASGFFFQAFQKGVERVKAQEIAREGRRIAAFKSPGTVMQGYTQWCWHSGENPAGKSG